MRKPKLEMSTDGNTRSVEPGNTKSDSHQLLNDMDIAGILGVSKPWVRVERFKRRHGESHNFNIDPVMIGSMPRYRIADVHAWIKGLSPDNDNASGTNGGEGRK
jgi:hypothetical protein